ncbi:hypothetical protein AGMMS50212_15200 [Spirochaetia bacterium]|nr:hypothetical protein AGMMS50212_15200 [Spirochaetia bacterium]
MSPKNGLKLVLFLIFLTFITLPSFCQDEEEDDDEDSQGGNRPPISSIWRGTDDSMYTRGDQIFAINMGVLLPLFITDKDGKQIPTNMIVGGNGALSYSYFLDPNTFVGAELQGTFSQTLSKNFLFFIPIGVKVGYQFVYKRFEFPFSLTIGGITEQYITYNLYCLYLKPQASGFFRFSPDWSFGVNAAWWWVPQWTNDSARDAYGNFFEITLAARYHF